MKVEKVIDDLRYTLSNEELKNGDEVFHIANGRCLDDDDWILHEIKFDLDFPNHPHILMDNKYSDLKPYQVKTDKEYGPIESYFKIIKKEHCQMVKEKGRFAQYKWFEI